MPPLVLQNSKARRLLAVLADPVQCPHCRRMAMLVVLVDGGGSCIACAPESK